MKMNFCKITNSHLKRWQLHCVLLAQNNSNHGESPYGCNHKYPITPPSEGHEWKMLGFSAMVTTSVLLKFILYNGGEEYFISNNIHMNNYFLASST